MKAENIKSAEESVNETNNGEKRKLAAKAKVSESENIEEKSQRHRRRHVGLKLWRRRKSLLGVGLSEGENEEANQLAAEAGGSLGEMAKKNGISRNRRQYNGGNNHGISSLESNMAAQLSIVKIYGGVMAKAYDVKISAAKMKAWLLET